MEALIYKYDQRGSKVQLYKILKWSSEGTDLFDMIHTFARLFALCNLYIFIVHAHLRIAQNMM